VRLTPLLVCVVAIACKDTSRPSVGGMAGSWALVSQAMVADSCCQTADVSNQYVRIYWTIRADSSFERVGELWSLGFTTVDRQTCTGLYHRSGGAVVFNSADVGCFASYPIVVAAFSNSMTMDDEFSSLYTFPDNVVRSAHHEDRYSRQ
jgi:hypothetical protein